MSQMSAIDNHFAVQFAGSGTFLPPGNAATTGAQIIESLVALVQERGTSAIKRGLFGALSIVTTGATMWLVGITMNCAFN
jgi:hypothetical protein